MAGGIDRLSVVSAGHEESVDQFIIYAGYGEVMHRLQVLEMSLWMIQSRGIKSQTRLDQAMAKVEKWNATTLGELMRGMRTQGHWPDGMVDKLLNAVDIRNYLAHHYLREYFVVAPSAANRDRATQELADLSVWVEELIDELEAHVLSLDIGSADELEEQMAREIEALRPAEWLGMPDRPE